MTGQNQPFAIPRKTTSSRHSKLNDQHHLTFLLDVNDGWPPVGAESFPVRGVGLGFEVLHPPLFIKDMSVGDVIDANLDAEGQVESWRHRTRSEHTTIWLLRLNEAPEIADVLAKLRALGCFTVGGNLQLGSYAIDVPPTLPIKIVDEVLSGLDAERVAVAFPSFRHIEPT